MLTKDHKVPRLYGNVLMSSDNTWFVLDKHAEAGCLFVGVSRFSAKPLTTLRKQDQIFVRFGGRVGVRVEKHVSMRTVVSNYKIQLRVVV